MRALITLSGAVERPGVYEIEHGTRLEELLRVGRRRPSRSPRLLLGGYFGSWVGRRRHAGAASLTPRARTAIGASLGCGRDRGPRRGDLSRRRDGAGRRLVRGRGRRAVRAVRQRARPRSPTRSSGSRPGPRRRQRSAIWSAGRRSCPGAAHALIPTAPFGSSRARCACSQTSSARTSSSGGARVARIRRYSQRRAPAPGLRARRLAAIAAMHLRRTVAAAAGVTALALAGCGGGRSPPRSTVVVVRSSTTASGSRRPPERFDGRHRSRRPRRSPNCYRARTEPARRASCRYCGGAARRRPGSRGPARAWRCCRSTSGLLELRLHAGTADPGGTGWRFGPAVSGAERARLAAAFNSGFRLSTGTGGYESYGRVAAPLQAGLASDRHVLRRHDRYRHLAPRSARSGSHGGIRTPEPEPADRQRKPASTLDCLSCWGATLGGVEDPARAALGVTADGRLIWAAGEHVTVADLANALLAARVVRAVELDINPEWVAGYVYGHRGRPRDRQRRSRCWPTSRGSRGSSSSPGAATSSRSSRDEPAPAWLPISSFGRRHSGALSARYLSWWRMRVRRAWRDDRRNRGLPR